MSESSHAERYLIDQIRAGDSDAWAQLLDRFQGRLLAFARSRSIPSADADDLVQETFLKFLNGLPNYREEASLETYLFMILRRRIVDMLRGKRVTACLAQEEDDSGAPGIEPQAADLTASTYARRGEARDQRRQALAAALGGIIQALKERHDFRDLKIMEALFYAQVRNKDIGRLLAMDEKAIALIKHRLLKQLRASVNELLGEEAAGEEADDPDSLLTEIWEEGRLSCPKRSTVGGYLLGTLDEAWQDYVQFHIDKLGCRFCRANLDDLKQETAEAPRQLRQRIMESTAGFFRKV